MIMGRFTGLNAKTIERITMFIHGKPICMEGGGAGSYSFKVEDREFVFMEDVTNDHYVACWLNILIYLVERFSGRAIGEELPESLAKFLFEFEAEFSTLESDVVKSLRIIGKAVDDRMSTVKKGQQHEPYYTPIRICGDPVMGTSDYYLEAPERTKPVKTLYKISDRFDIDYIGVRRPFLEEFGYCEATHLANHQNDLRRLIETFCTYLTTQLFEIGAYSATRHKKPIE